MNKRLRFSVLCAAAVTSLLTGAVQAASANAATGGDTARAHTTTRPFSSFYDEMHNRNSGKCVNVNHDRSDAGAPIQQYSCDHTPADKFLFVDLGNGYWEIEGQNSHECVAPENNWTGNGVPLVQWYCQGNDAQQWQLQPATNGSYRAVDKASGLCMTVPNWSSDDWLQLQQQYCWIGAANQEFYLLGG